MCIAQGMALLDVAIVNTALQSLWPYTAPR